MKPGMHSGKSFWIALAVAASLCTGHAVAQSQRAAARLTLTEVDREPDKGRAAPSDKELEALRAAARDDDKNRLARFELVRGLMRAGQMQEALQEATAWRERDAYNLVVVRLLGDIYSELGEKAQALRAYSAVVELLPEDPSAQRALASVLKQNGNLKAAYQRLAAASALRPDDVRIGFEVADAAHRIGRLDEARTRFEAIADSSEASMAVRYPARQRLAQIYAEERRQASESGDQARVTELGQKIKKLAIKGGVENDIKVYLTWDTDRSDVDLWVTNPAGEKVFYSHRKGKFGGALYDDVTTGYGPESFTARKAARGTYLVQVNYYSAGRSNFPEARGEVVVVLHEGTANEEKHVLPYRLFRKGQIVTVARIRAH